MVKKRASKPRKRQSKQSRRKKSTNRNINRKIKINRFRSKTINMEEKKIIKKFNTNAVRKKLFKGITSGKIKIGNCDDNFKNTKKLQYLYELKYRHGDKNRKYMEPHTSEVAKMCIDAECNKKAIIKISPLFKVHNLTPTGKNNDTEGKLYNPSTSEIAMIKLLTEKVVLKDITPNITIYYTSFQCKDISNLFQTTKYLDYLFKKKEQVSSDVNVLVAEFVDGLDFYKFNQRVVKPTSEFIPILKSLFFQVIITLAILQDKFQFTHFDLHGGNVLVDESIEPGGFWKYKAFGKEYYVPNFGYQSKLWDFDFASTFKGDIIQNSKVFSKHFQYAGITPVFNPQYDIFFFLNAINSSTGKENLPTEIRNFIWELFPPEYRKREVPNLIVNGRLVNPSPQLPTPLQLLSHPFFAEYLIKQPNVIKPIYKYKN